ncbi:lipoprotein insertase outer membrane protein LolB [Castellaniella sp.]|uniref:lipoprotein insertase outer membrane protein LolB n=1 Tax=Castellaniella sp. TaxID=1955812 RepID=UPI002AFF9D43|nr:lipoprotein insertase outer membrane protein LolB [Castellaniella sp.]
MTLLRIGRLLAGVGLALVLAACAAPARIGGQGPAFERVGRFAVNLQPLAQPPYAAQGGFSWRDDGRSLRLDLSNPLGSVLARIRVEPDAAVLERADGSRESAPSPDALLTQVWGHPMPVAGLRYWIRGQAAPGQAVGGARQDEQGRLAAFQQEGWDVRLSDYDDQGPLRVRLSRQDDQGQWRLQLIMDRS